jgi:hypothetical protein
MSQDISASVPEFAQRPEIVPETVIKATPTYDKATIPNNIALIQSK